MRRKKIETLTKKLRTAEVKRRCVCLPKNKQHLFPKVGSKLSAKDEQTGSSFELIVGSQYRLQMPTWYDKHKEIKPGDMISFKLDNGLVSVNKVVNTTGSPINMFERRDGKVSILEGKVLDIIVEALAGIEVGDYPATVKVGQNGILIEWGPHIKETEITLGNVKVSLD